MDEHYFGPRSALKAWLRLIIGAMCVLFLYGLLLPPTGPHRIHEWRTLSMSNLKQISLTLQIEQNANPSGELTSSIITDAHGQPLYSWRVLILPELGYQELYEQFDLSKPWDSPENRPLIAKMPEVYLSPRQSTETTDGLTAYQTLVEDGPHQTVMLPTKKRRPRDITDGHSNTALLVEELDKPVIWTQPDDVTPAEFLETLDYYRRPARDVLMVTADGATRAFRTSEREDLWPFMYANDGKVPSE